MRVGEIVSFSIKVEFGEGVPPSGIGVTSWSSTNPDVITIDASGKATAIRRGNATIERTVHGHKVTQSISVAS
jgi:hypothetical protein